MADVGPVKETFFKVLVDGKPCHGGNTAFVWHLPAASKPGKWTKHEGDLMLCRAGLHLTRDPLEWFVDGGTLYEAEYRGELLDDGGDKVCVREARLLREVDWTEIPGFYREGWHSVSTGRAFASGSATVEAFDSATVRAFDSATVRASDSATVRASDSATVEASGSATVRAFDSATVRASDSATVEAFDSATVRASGSATVESTIYHHPGAEVALEHMAAHIDRRNGKLVLRGGGKELAAA